MWYSFTFCEVVMTSILFSPLIRLSHFMTPFFFWEYGTMQFYIFGVKVLIGSALVLRVE
nr:MAG TPA: hypothetical protein [Caudoviricetes sp.]